MAAVLSVAHARGAGPSDTPRLLGDCDWFRRVFYGSLLARADALFELTDAVLCADGPVTSLVELTLGGEHRRGHGAMYDALNAGRVEPARLRRTVASSTAGVASSGSSMPATQPRPPADRQEGETCLPCAPKTLQARAVMIGLASDRPARRRRAPRP